MRVETGVEERNERLLQKYEAEITRLRAALEEAVELLRNARHPEDAPWPLGWRLDRDAFLTRYGKEAP